MSGFRGSLNALKNFIHTSIFMNRRQRKKELEKEYLEKEKEVLEDEKEDIENKNLVSLKGTQHTTPQNDYCQHYIDTGDRPQNFIRDVGW